MSDEKPRLEPTLLIVFGITGDLAAKKLLPSLYHLVKDNLFHEQTVILGITRKDLTGAELLQHVNVCVNELDHVCDPVALAKMQEKLKMYTMDPEDPKQYAGLKEYIDHIEEEQGVCMNRLFYMALPSHAFEPVVQHLGDSGLNKGCEHGHTTSRLLIEKPFGWDVESAQHLVDVMSEKFHEDQLFRIDHYLAREMVQNILVFRRENPLFQDLWNSDHIESIHILAKEQIGIEGRTAFYEQTGAMRDFIQNHLLQLLAITTMELPVSMNSNDVHYERLQLLRRVHLSRQHGQPAVVRGQYVTYRDEVNNPHSMTETYARVMLRIASDRWKNTHITLETGKAMNEKSTTITLQFRSGKQPGKLIFSLYPNEGIEVDLVVKKPGYDEQVQTAQMSFRYRDNASLPAHPDAYERVLVDAARGDRTLFTTSDETITSWEIVQPILDYWHKGAAKLVKYPSGSVTVTHQDS